MNYFMFACRLLNQIAKSWSWIFQVWVPSIQCLQHFLGKKAEFASLPIPFNPFLLLSGSRYFCLVLPFSGFPSFSSLTFSIHDSKLGVPIKTTVSATVLEEALNGLVTIRPLPLGQFISKRVSCCFFFNSLILFLVVIFFFFFIFYF